MKLLVTLLVAFSCVCALTIPSPHGAIEPRHHLTSASKVQLEGNDAESAVTIDKSVMNSITAGGKKQDTDFSELHPVLPQSLVTTRDDAIDSPEDDSTAKQVKPILDEVDDYNRDHPRNRIPTFVMCHHPRTPQLSATVHHRDAILATLNEGHRLRRDVGYLDRPSFSGTHYPHQFQFTDLYSQSQSRVRRTDVGEVHGNMHMFPILVGGNQFVTGQHPFFDRVMFDDEGNYLGVMTWRSEWWWWCTPIHLFGDNDAAPDRGASASGVPGVDEAAMRTPPPQNGWVDARNPFGGGSHMP